MTPIGTSHPWCKGIERSTLGLRNSKVEGLRGNGDGGNPAKSAGNPRDLVQKLRKYRGMKLKLAGVLTGIGFIVIGSPRNLFGKFGCDRNLNRKHR